MGCQSMGCRRSSEEREGLNFHLRMTVQMMPAAPMEAPMAMRMMIVFRCSLVTLPEFDDVEAAVVAAAIVLLVIVRGPILDGLWASGVGVIT